MTKIFYYLKFLYINEFPTLLIYLINKHDN